MPRSFKILTGLFAVVAGAVLLGLDWIGLSELGFTAQWGLLWIVVFVFISEWLALTFVVGKNASSASLTFILVVASVGLFGPDATVIVAIMSGLLAQYFQRKPTVVAVFNLSQFVFVTAIACAAYAALGGQWSVTEFVVEPLPFMAFGVVLGAGNLLAVSLGLALKEQMHLKKVIRQVFGAWGANLFYDLLVSPVALLVVVLFVQFGLVGLVLAAFTLFFIRRSYLTNYQLQEANRDLLNALVKAIETRDPYTSGHSRRVASLARSIAEQLGMRRTQIESVETAALLHDIGKIDEIFATILSKPGRLTPEERVVIASHATKGADFLRSISSFRPDIILAVRHHHERIDGNGYPDRMLGDEIPIGARIIKVCDAVDAMLSNRPYRNALPLPAVRQQLVEYAGVQFDLKVVQAVISTGMLEAHQSDLAATQEVGGKDIRWGASRPRSRQVGAGERTPLAT